MRPRVRSSGDHAGAENRGLIDALVSGGDSRLALGQPDWINKYLCPPAPAPEVICASSCTASPISERGFQRAGDFYTVLAAESRPERRRVMLEQCGHDIAARLLAHFGAAGVGEAILCPSGTDALLMAAMLIGLERPSERMTAILPMASETGTGVARAATLRAFDGTAPSDVPLIDCSADAVAISLRSADGMKLADDEVVDAYAAASAGVSGRAVVYLTHGTKTGLIAPLVPPAGAEVIVDACQGRIEPAAVVAYLCKGWPVVVTGSKFFGGPAFSGAVLVPSARFPRISADCARFGMRPSRSGAVGGNPGMLLRWLAGLEGMEAFAPVVASLPGRLLERAAAIEQGIDGIDALVPIPGLSNGGSGWSDIPTIFTFAMRDPMQRQRLLSAAELRRIYLRLARNKVLVGQPVDLGRFGGLRLAVGARDFLPGAPADGDLARLFAALAEATAG